MVDIISRITGMASYAHVNREISHGSIVLAGLETLRVRTASLPPALTNGMIRLTVSKYGVVQEIRNETCSQLYRYQVSNRIRIVTVHLTKYVPSHIYIAGQRARFSYIGQPATCYSCNATDHLLQHCHRQRLKPMIHSSPTAPYSHI